MRAHILIAGAIAIVVAVTSFQAMRPEEARASNHREAPITALDHKADITDLYAFVSYDENTSPNETPSHVTMILCVDPLLEPGNGPTTFPFDPDILYEINVDNDHDALADLTFRFRFETEYQLPDVYTALAGFGPTGANAPGTTDLVVPPQITDFDNPGLNQRQTYKAAVVFENGSFSEFDLPNDAPKYVVPCNAGPRTLDYDALFQQAIYSFPGQGVKLFAGTVDDPFFIDLGATFDTANFRTLGSGVPGVLTAAEDSAKTNFASDTISGFAVNAIAIEVPISMLTSSGQVEAPSEVAATIGVWGTTSRPRNTVRRHPNDGGNVSFGEFRQVQRFGNSLMNELLIGIGSKDRYSMEQPINDAQFAPFYLDPPIVRIVEALYGGALTVPSAPRNDLLPLVTYNPLIAAPGTPAGPIADMMRLNTGVSATPVALQERMGLLAGDAAGYPNGRRLVDDVVDITLRVGVGGVLLPAFNIAPNNVLGDGVNVNDAPLRTSFPYLASCPSGRNRRHIDPGEVGGGPVN